MASKLASTAKIDGRLLFIMEFLESRKVKQSIGSKITNKILVFRKYATVFANTRYWLPGRPTNWHHTAHLIASQASCHHKQFTTIPPSNVPFQRRSIIDNYRLVVSNRVRLLRISGTLRGRRGESISLLDLGNG